MSTKNLIRTVVILGILAWPATETFRLWDTTQKLHQAQALVHSVDAKLASARQAHAQAQVARVDAAAPAK